MQPMAANLQPRSQLKRFFDLEKDFTVFSSLLSAFISWHPSCELQGKMGRVMASPVLCSTLVWFAKTVI